jgi:tRNA-splicing ligase RtcB
MGSYSYIIEGKGNPDSFESCSHGAGRVISRRQANQTFTTKEVLEDLHQRNVILGKKNKKNVAEECIWSYKPIEEVIKNELDLIKIKKKLKTVAVVKG